MATNAVSSTPNQDLEDVKESTGVNQDLFYTAPKDESGDAEEREEIENIEV